MNTIRIMVVRPLSFPCVEHHKYETERALLDVMQRIVDGYIECVPIGDGIDLFCNEDGRLKNFPPNRRIPGGPIILGTFFLARRHEDYTVGLTLEDIQKLYRELATWTTFAPDGDSFKELK